MVYFLALMSRWIISGLLLLIHKVYEYPNMYKSPAIYAAIVIASYDIFIKLPQFLLKLDFETSVVRVCKCQQESIKGDVKVVSWIVYVVSMILLLVILSK